MIHLWRTENLARELANNTLSERDSAHYMMASAIIYTYLSYAGLWLAGGKDWMLFVEAALVICVSLIGINECFKANGSIVGKLFLTRFCALSVPVNFKLALLGVALGLATNYGFPHIVTESNFRNPDLVYRISSVVIAFICTVLSYWRIAHHISSIRSFENFPKQQQIVPF